MQFVLSEQLQETKIWFLGPSKCRCTNFQKLWKSKDPPKNLYFMLDWVWHPCSRVPHNYRVSKKSFCIFYLIPKVCLGRFDTKDASKTAPALNVYYLVWPMFETEFQIFLVKPDRVSNCFPHTMWTRVHFLHILWEKWSFSPTYHYLGHFW